MLLPTLPIVAHHPDVVGGAGDPAERVVHEGRGNAARVRWCDARASARGVRPGQTLAAARARCATLRTAEHRADAMRDARREVLSRVLAHTPRVAVAGEARLWAEPAPRGEPLEAWGEEVCEALAWAGARVGVAEWASAAYAAALVAAPCRVVDDAHAFLGRAPLAALELDAKTRDRLGALGIHRVDELRRLDPVELGVRFGPAVADAWRRAGGDDPRIPWTPSPERLPSVSLAFDEIALGEIEPLLFLLRGALAKLLRAPRGRGEGLSALTMSLRLERAAPLELTIRAAQPIAHERPWLDLVQAKLERVARPGGADDTRIEHVHGLELRAIETGPVRDATADLYGGTERDPTAREVALARLAGRFGEDALRRASRSEAAHPLARACWAGAEPSPGVPLPWRRQHPPAAVEGGQVAVGGRLRRVLKRGRTERAIAPWWTSGAMVVERLAWAEVEGPLLVLLRERGRPPRWEAVAWID